MAHMRAGHYKRRNDRQVTVLVDPVVASAPIRTIGPYTDTVDPEHSRVCPTCQTLVGVRQDGGLRSHRRGPNRRYSWPCPGEDRGIA